MVATLDGHASTVGTGTGTTDTNTKERHIALVGPTSVGKGYTLKKLKARLEKSGTRFHVISLGDMIRKRMENDQTFHAQHSKTVADGELLAYEVVTPMVEGEYEAGRKKESEVFIWDGYARDGQQMERMLGIWRSPKEKHRIFFLQAREETCRKRLDDAIAAKRREKRTDSDKFPERYSLHASNEPHVIKAAKDKLGNYRVINADRCLELVVAEILFHSTNIM